MQENSEAFVGLDTSKQKISVAVADTGRTGEVRFFGDIDSAPAMVEHMVKKLAKRHQKLRFCYEAGPTGYGLHRQITALGHECVVVAPSMIPRRPGERVKTNRRDAVSLAKLHRAGELTPVWVPDPAHEAVRELVRARETAVEGLRRARQHLQSFLLRHGRIYTGRTAWSKAHTRWLCEQRFDHPAQHIVLTEYRQAIEDAEARLERLTQQVTEIVTTWSMAPVIAAYQAVRGVAFLTAVTFAVEIGDVSRFDNPRQLMAYLGLVPSENSTGERVRRGSITKIRQPAGASRAGRGRVDILLPRTHQSHPRAAAERPAEGRAGDSLESAGSTLRPLSQADGERQASDRRRGRNRSRDVSLSLGDRAAGQAAFGGLIEVSAPGSDSTFSQ